MDSFFPILADFDDRIDELEDGIFRKADDQQLQEIFQMKRLLVGIRKAITPQRDTFARVMGGVAELPGLDAEDERYFRDVYDHLIRISDLVDSYRDLLTGAMDVYLSTVSNRLNAVMKQLTIIATIFLPLSWLTGFFGQNFGFEVAHIGSWESFVGLGIGTELLGLAHAAHLLQAPRLVLTLARPFFFARPALTITQRLATVFFLVVRSSCSFEPPPVVPPVAPPVVPPRGAAAGSGRAERREADVVTADDAGGVRDHDSGVVEGALLPRDL